MTCKIMIDFVYLLYVCIIFNPRHVDVIDQVELRNPRQVTHLPPVWDFFTSLGIDTRQKGLVSLPKNAGKVG